MGLFDSFYIDSRKLPGLTEEEYEALKDKEWQTKDLECYQQEYRLNEEGELILYGWHWEPNLEFDESKEYPDDLLGAFQRLADRKKTIYDPPRIEEYTGAVNFYTDLEDKWYEFCAMFHKGKLLNIFKISPNEE